MRRIYLIRHALPDLPPGKKRCIGCTDVPLGTLGRLQSVVLGEYMKTKPVSAVFCSGLSRAMETARAISQDPIIVPDLREMDAGEWDGLLFDEIRQKWPEIYEKRGADPNYPIPGAELPEHGQARFTRAVETILQKTAGDLAIVAHCTVIQSFLSFVLGTDVKKCRDYRLDYTGICTIGYDHGEYSVLDMNEIPAVPLTDALCEALLTAAGAPLEHCRNVAERADRITRALIAAGISLDREQIRFGAMLHDIARKEQNHTDAGAQWMDALGYPEIADIVRTHHDPDTDEICEKTVVFLADKLPVEERFSRSFSKCTTEAARAAHARRQEAALTLKEKINSLCGKELIP